MVRVGLSTDLKAPVSWKVIGEEVKRDGSKHQPALRDLLVPTHEPGSETLRGALGHLGKSGVKLVGGVLGAAVASVGGLAATALYGALGLGVGAVFGALGGLIGGATGNSIYIENYAFANIGALTHKRVAEKIGSRVLGAIAGIPMGVVGDGLKGAFDLSRILVANEVRQVGRFLVGVSEMMVR